jgi:hypothetical protein
MRRMRFVAVAVTLMIGAGAVVAPAGADNGTQSAALRTAVTPAGITTHLQAFQAFADANGGTRSAHARSGQPHGHHVRGRDRLHLHVVL